MHTSKISTTIRVKYPLLTNILIFCQKAFLIHKYSVNNKFPENSDPNSHCEEWKKSESWLTKKLHTED